MSDFLENAIWNEVELLNADEVSNLLFEVSELLVDIIKDKNKED